jgi:hypothetical protein
MSSGPKSSDYALAVLVRRVLAIAPIPVGLVAVLLPWSTSGITARSAFSLVRALEGIGAVLPAWDQIALRAAYAFPVIAACSLAAAVLGRIRLSAALAVMAALVVVTASIVAIEQFGTDALLGPWVGGIGCAIAMGSAAVVMIRKEPRHV